MRVLHFFEHVAELEYSKHVLVRVIGYPLIKPAEDRVAHGDKFYRSWTMVVKDLICQGPGVTPDKEGDGQDTEKYGVQKQYGCNLHGRYPFRVILPYRMRGA